MLLRPCDVENIADFNRYYGSGWVGWHEEGKKEVTPAFVSNPGNGGGTALKFLYKTDGVFTLGSWNILNMEDLEKRLDFGRPDIGMTEDGPTVVFLSYSTPRAPTKGLRTRDARPTGFNDYEVRNYKLPRSNERYDWVHQAFNPVYDTLEEGLKKLNNGDRVGVALSRFMALFTDPNIRYPVLAYKRWPIGYLDNKKVILNPQYGEYAGPVTKELKVEVSV